MITWIIGLSGSGKTTLATSVITSLRSKGRSVVLLDGDAVRELYGNDLGHSMTDRRTNADRICKLSAFLDSQNIDVVVAILSLFPDTRDWCRNNLSSYYEVFIDCDLHNLKNRDSKGLYSRFDSGEITNVAGCDLHFPRPASPDLIISNNSSLDNLLAHTAIIVDKFISS